MTRARGARSHRPDDQLVLAAVVFTALCGAPVVLDAQTVRGAIQDDATGEAVGVVMVVLRHMDGSRAATTLSNETGHYVIRAPGADRYTVFPRQTETGHPVPLHEKATRRSAARYANSSLPTNGASCAR